MSFYLNIGLNNANSDSNSDSVQDLNPPQKDNDNPKKINNQIRLTFCRFQIQNIHTSSTKGQISRNCGKY